MSDNPFVVTEAGGTWGRAQRVPGTLTQDTDAGVEAISCPSPQACTAAGFSFPSVFVVSTGTPTAAAPFCKTRFPA